MDSWSTSLLPRDSSGYEPIPQEAVEPTVVAIRAQLYCFFILAALLLWDVLTTYDKEVKYFWCSPKKYTSVLYFLNRYAGVYGAISVLFADTYWSTLRLCKACRFAIWSFSLTNTFIVVSVDCILMTRVLALHQKNQIITRCLVTLLVLETISRLICTIYVDIAQDIVVAAYSPSFRVCDANVTLPTFLGILEWSAPLVYGFILMVLALWKAADYWKTSARLRGLKLVSVVIEDQILYFTVALACSLFSILQFKYVDNFVLANVLEGLGSPTLLCVLGSRMMFNLKEAGERGLNVGTNVRSVPITSVTEMRFS